MKNVVAGIINTLTGEIVDVIFDKDEKLSLLTKLKQVYHYSPVNKTFFLFDLTSFAHYTDAIRTVSNKDGLTTITALYAANSIESDKANLAELEDKQSTAKKLLAEYSSDSKESLFLTPLIESELEDIEEYINHRKSMILKHSKEIQKHSDLIQKYQIA